MPSDEALLQEIRDRYTYADTEWSPIRREAEEDMRHVGGDPWKTKDREAREKAGRPCIALDELGQYHNQVINDLRANPRGMKFSPTGNGANDQGAEFYANKAREIEYRSTAQVAYITAAENMIQRSYGWTRVKTDYESERSDNQTIVIDPVMNPDNVLPDPDAVWPDSRDMRYLFYLESRLQSEFKREFPGAKIQDFKPEHVALAPAWIKSDRVLLAEYWTKQIVKKRLLIFEERPTPEAQAAMQAGRVWIPQRRGLFEDELQNGRGPEGYEFKRERPNVETTKVTQYLTNGVEILDTRSWLGKHIPFVSAFGKVIYVNEGGGTKRKILSMTRLARDPYMAYCFYRTCEMEIVGMTTKNPYWAYRGQLNPTQLQEVAKSVHEPVAVLLAEPVLHETGNQLVPLPTRNQFTADIASFSVGAEEMRRAIQASMGISPLPTSAQRLNEKSGRALKQIEASGQKGSFHFGDHYNGMIQRVGIIIEDLMDKVYDNARDVWVRKPNRDSARVRINDGSPDSISTKGDYEVTVDIGPADDSQRDAADEFIESVAQPATVEMIANLKGPAVASKLLATALRIKQLGPQVDDLADAIDPPQKQGQTPQSPELQQAMGKIQQLEQTLQQAAQEKQTEAAKFEAQAKIETMKAQSAERLKMVDIEWQREKAHLDSATKLDVAAISAKVDRLTLLVNSLQQVADIAHGRESMAVDATEAAKDRIHELNMAQIGHQQALEQGAQSHDQALEQQDAGIRGQMATQQQAADLAPGLAEAGA